jgi:hypothetical protein
MQHAAITDRKKEYFMNRQSLQLMVLVCLELMSRPAGATFLQHMSLARLTHNAQLVFRGTVLDVVPGTVVAGGGELASLTYRLRVDEAIKGTLFQSKGDEAFAEVTMLSDGKDRPTVNSVTRLLSFARDIPQLEVGRTYLLFTTEPSAVGLSTTVGLKQGCFDITRVDKQEVAENGFDNAGLFGRAARVSSQRGPVLYRELVGEIRRVLAESGEQD